MLKSINNVTNKTPYVEDGAMQIIKEAIDFSTNRGLNPNTSINEIFANPQTYASFIKEQSKGLDAGEAELYESISEVSRGQVLKEAGSFGNTLSPIVQIQPMILRRFLAMTCMINQFPTESVNKVDIEYKMEYPKYIDRDGVVYDFREYFRDEFASTNNNDMTGLIPIYDGFTDILKFKDMNLLTGKDSTGAVIDANFDLVTGGKATKIDEIDKVLGITEVKMSIFVAPNAVVPAGAAFEVVVKTKIFAEPYGHVYGVVTYTSDEDNQTTYGIPKGTVFNDTVTGMLSRSLNKVLLNRTNEVTLPVAANKCQVKEIKLYGHVSNMYNNHVEEVGFDQDYIKLSIPHGLHVAASLPQEFLEEYSSAYGQDGYLKLTEIIADYLAYSTELEGYRFLRNSYLNNDFEEQGYIANFDVRPSQHYAGFPDAWANMFKSYFDLMAINMKNDLHIPTGKFVIIGNPIDVQILERSKDGLQWQYKGSADGERMGVKVGYAIATYEGSEHFEITSSQFAKESDMRMIFYPDVQNYITYKYFPFSFSVQNNNGYRNVNKPNIPAIVFIRRHLFAEVTPMQGLIQVENNNLAALTAYRA